MKRPRPHATIDTARRIRPEVVTPVDFVIVLTTRVCRLAAASARSVNRIDSVTVIAIGDCSPLVLPIAWCYLTPAVVRRRRRVALSPSAEPLPLPLLDPLPF